MSRGRSRRSRKSKGRRSRGRSGRGRGRRSRGRRRRGRSRGRRSRRGGGTNLAVLNKEHRLVPLALLLVVLVPRCLRVVAPELPVPRVGEDGVLHAGEVDDEVTLVALSDRVAGDAVGRLLLVPGVWRELLDARVSLKVEAELLISLVGRVVDNRHRVDRHRQPGSAVVPVDKAGLGGLEDFDNILHRVVMLEVEVKAPEVLDRGFDRDGCYRDRRK